MFFFCLIAAWNPGSRTVFPWTMPPGQLPPVQLPPGQLPPDNSHLGQLLLGQLSPGQFPPITIAPWTISPDTSHRGLLYYPQIITSRQLLSRAMTVTNYNFSWLFFCFFFDNSIKTWSLKLFSVIKLNR